MSKRNYVCFNCRTAVRREQYIDRDVLCPDCGKPCENIGYKIPVPAKSKPQEWEDLRERFYAERRDQAEQERIYGVQRRHELENEIAELEGRPSNAGRSAAIKRLRRILQSLGD
jgi:hypothetical protein